MRLRLDKPWQPLTAETAQRLPGQLGAPQEGRRIGRHVERRSPRTAGMDAGGVNLPGPVGLAQGQREHRDVPGDMAMHHPFARIGRHPPFEILEPLLVLAHLVDVVRRLRRELVLPLDPREPRREHRREPRHEPLGGGEGIASEQGFDQGRQIFNRLIEGLFGGNGGNGCGDGVF